MKKYPKIYNINNRSTKGIFSRKGWLSEKLDGSCGRFQLTADGFHMGSKNVSYEKRPEGLKVTPFMLFWDFIAVREDHLRKFIPETWTVFGEVVGKRNSHKIQYPFDFNFVVFDVFDEEKMSFIRPNEWIPTIRDAELDFIPHDYMSCSYDVLDALLKDYDPVETLSEGFVFKTYKNERPDGIFYTKAKCEKFMDMHSNIPEFTILEGPDEVEGMRLLQEWITEERFLSVLHQGFDDGSIDPDEGKAMMRWLAHSVWKDAVQEEFSNYILSSHWKHTDLNLDINWMRNTAAKMVLRLLDWWIKQRAEELHSSDGE